jgi:cell division protein FtsB
MKAAFAFGACLLLFGLSGDDRGLRGMLQARREASALAAEIQALRAENAVLRRRAEALRRDPAAIEAVARETLGFVRPGEILVTRPARPAVPLR